MAGEHWKQVEILGILRLLMFFVFSETLKVWGDKVGEDTVVSMVLKS